MTLIIDGLNIFIRSKTATSYFNAKDKTKATIENFLAVYSSLNKLLPEEIIIIWEHPDYAKKREFVPTYKLNRFPIMDTKLIGEIKKLCFYLGMTQYEWIGKEADECAAYLAFKNPYKKLNFYSADKDWLQLCDNDNHIVMLPSSLTKTKTNLGTYQLYNKTRFLGEYKFLPYKFALHKTIVGDYGDNIKSIGGVDKNKALELVLKYENMEDILTEKFTPKVQEYIDQNRQLIINCYYMMDLLRDYSEVKDEEFKITTSKKDPKMLAGFFKMYKISEKSRFGII